jgi:hypothetical protein
LDDDEADEDEAVGDDTPSSSSQRVRRSPVEMDRLRARMIQAGYPLAELTRKENDRVWQSLTQRRRWPQLVRLTGMSDTDLWERVKAISQQYRATTGKR